MTIEPPAAATHPTGPGPAVGWADRWDLAVLAVLPALAVMLACAVTPPDVLPHTNPDVLLYFRVAGEVAAGRIPYLDFAFEYPPLAVVPMTLPYLAWPPGQPGLLEYQWFWAIQNALLAGLVAGLVAWLAARGAGWASPPRALATWALVALLQAPLIAWRFDIAAVALAVGGVALVVAGRTGAAGVALAVGALVKVYPVALAPVLLAWLLVRGDRRGAVRLVLGGAAAGISIVAIAAAIVGIDPVMQFVAYQDERLVQIESVASSVALALHLLVGQSVTLGYGFQSLQVSGPGLDVVLALESAMLAGGVILVTILAALRFRWERRTLGQPGLPTLVAYLMAVVIAVIVTNKVFSAQYLLWMLPFGCLMPRRQAAVVVTIAALSILVFPLSYNDLADLRPSAVALLVARNALLVGLLLWALVRFRPWVGRIASREGYDSALAASERTS